MTESLCFESETLRDANLHVDATYRGRRSGNSGDDPFPDLLNVSNQGGFRYRGNLNKLELVVLTSSLNDPDWPDSIDEATGVFTYFGDNKKPGRLLHETPRNGNELLRRIFELAKRDAEGRIQVPPIFVFANAGSWRDVVFLGLAVPGTVDTRPSEDLIAIWKSVGGKRFQNYRARFTILDVPVVTRSWINDIRNGHPRSSNAPPHWLSWVKGGNPKALMATATLEYRTKSQQLPQNSVDLEVLDAIHGFFADRPHDFEECAATLARMLLPDITSLDLTRPSRDGGRDAIGMLRIGQGATSIVADFALEAKCYQPSSSVGVREMSRLISRLRHRQFGILVTTSYVDLQAYREIKEDRHPIIVMSGLDIVALLRVNGYSGIASVLAWLKEGFSPTQPQVAQHSGGAESPSLA
jgi:hypothetical protein